MWDKLKDVQVTIVVLIGIVIAWAISWVLVFKFGWRGWAITGSLDANQSFTQFVVTLGVVIPILLIVLLAVFFPNSLSEGQTSQELDSTE